MTVIFLIHELVYQKKSLTFEPDKLLRVVFTLLVYHTHKKMKHENTFDNIVF